MSQTSDDDAASNSALAAPRINRRGVLLGSSAALIAGSVSARASDTGAGQPFTADTVRTIAADLATRAFDPPRSPVTDALKRLTYDQYRDIRFQPRRALWRGERLGHEVQLFPLGWLYDTPIAIHIVEGGIARAVRADPALFTAGPLAAGDAAAAATSGFSGFRLHRPINRPDYLDEYLVFQGASYFRAVARGEGYGLSARGLAIGTAQPGGEEFPLFRAFWIEKPEADAQSIVVHALLDSPSIAGAYRFEVTAGAPTVMDVRMALMPRKEIAHLGLAPLTSMFLLGPAHDRGIADFRPAVHDSEGLSLVTGQGEQIWRPLANPRTLQSSAFMDRNPRGFGLVQRDRRFSSFEDLEARYDLRPSCWIRPTGEWGEGSVDLIEIPTDEEIHDNIVSFWRPRRPLRPGPPLELSYRMLWTGPEAPQSVPALKVLQTRCGPRTRAETFTFVVDFGGPGFNAEPDKLPRVDIKTSAGTIQRPVIERHPDPSRARVSFDLAPGSAQLAEMRLALMAGDKQISETWVYRWTRA